MILTSFHHFFESNQLYIFVRILMKNSSHEGVEVNSKYLRVIIVLIALVILCVPSLFLNPSYLPSSEVNTVEASTLATDVTRDIRIAIYSETNATAPSYTEGFGGAVHNNATGMRDILELAGYTNIDIVTVKNISEHCLVTAKYDVFMIIDNFPRENITHLIWDFWAGGGGILSLDRSGIFLCHTGILPPESAGSSGYGVYWAQSTYQDLIIDVRHPISQSYSLPTTVLTSQFYLMWYWDALSASSIGSNLVGVAHNTYGMYAIDVLTYEPDSGGKVVSLSLDLVTDQTPDAYPLIQDSVDWLCPRPKARIAFDFSHMPRLGVDDHDMYTNYPGEYSELRNSSVAHGCTFDKLYPTEEGNITYNRLFNDGYAGYDLLIVVLPDYPYSSQELADIDRWALEGHALLVFAETGASGLFTDAVIQINNMLANMDCQINMDEYDIASPQTYQLHLTNEYAYSLYMNVHGFVNLTGPDAYALWKTGSDITMAASEYHNGRVIVSADMNWATDDQITLEDNAQYLINAINWLTSAEVNILLFTDETLSLNHYRTPVANALNDLSYRYYFVRDPFYLPMALNDQHWDLVIIDNVGYQELEDYLSDLLTYVNQGGRLLMSTCDTHHSPGHDLWAALGFEYAKSATTFDSTHMWNAYHSIFNIPHIFTTGYFIPEITYGTPGDYLTVTTGTALGGWFVIPRDGNASLVLGASGRTLFNSFVIDEFTNDLDDSAYSDNFELWENEIAYMMRPLLTHPEDIYMTERDDDVINWFWDPPAQLYGAPFYEYELRLNGSILETGFLEGAIVGGWVQRLASLSPGMYVYNLKISGRFAFTDNDTVIVVVGEAPYTTPTSTTNTTGEPSTTTTSTIGNQGIPEIYLISLAIGGIGVIVILAAIFFRAKPVPANVGRLLQRKNRN